MGKVAIDPDGADELARRLEDLSEAIGDARSTAWSLRVRWRMLSTWQDQQWANGLAGRLRTAAAIVRGDDNLPSNWPQIAAQYDLADHIELADLERELSNHAEMELDQLEHLLELAREAEIPPADYAEALQDYWDRRALERAGIDPDEWDPSLGADAQADIIERVYVYYAEVYGEDNDLIWAGMANMIGPSFAAGFFDLAEFRDIAQRVRGRAALSSFLPATPFWSRISGTLLAEAADMTDQELAYYETTFLQMQKDIFFDLAPVHEAYLSGGIEAVEEMRAAGIIDQDVYNAWEDISSGDPALVEQGNEALLLREQRDIIDDYYQDMYNRFPSGPVVTQFMTWIGAPSIPGAKSYPEVFDWSGNIAHFEDRWDLIQQDTLPAFLDLWRDDRERTNDIISSPVGPRIDEQRMKERFPPLGWILDGPPIGISLPDVPGFDPSFPSPIDFLFPRLPW
ncbi:hypothetical protein [Phytoactinopolyspora mesophila]|uniref:WXG100 family type VII secretion target n=1 Tax=Phytoactinopolyspora mesophila TaxID=2650750 RepID=A0A7K3M9E1_9ACTN|nr:hypothetical protein [Phytoactinopolyspora mesophila]NDL59909.1 hypothetical protein [Phytoactinopolyspora mesophila]